MSGILWLLVSLQDPVQQQIDESVRQVEAAGDVEEALTLLSSQLVALTAALPQFDPGSERDVVDFLIALDTPLARELLRSIAGDDRLPPAVRTTPEDPQELVTGPAHPRAAAPVARSVV